MIKKHGSAIWNGTIKGGSGKVSTESGVLDNAPYGFKQRFEGEKGTNPEELAGAAHAACFSMALSLQLEQAGMEAEEISTKATVSLDKVEGGFEISKVHLDLTAKIPGADEAKFQEAAANAKAGCPISKLFKGAEITLDAKLA
ncbi:peroxiredoxin [Primorskyibacter flagellatus]|jgi:osmotically inducible protein OsmC|uniref:Peroxiredoxin n=1 Tax=Primorskyibacter flagellatus TaxID=1387277 RepID=A0A917EF53_9RHOB|nr:OsmC family protein [Primorskyibacter flagellatus]GGE26190.1 peroxiredoxin [Primorskyibacter flagellatus]